MDESSGIGNRRHRRSNVLLAASIEADGMLVHVKLRNLSPRGALIQADALPREGARVLFRRNDLSVAGRLAWVDGKYGGVEFDQQLQPEDVMRNIPAPRPKPTGDFRRPGLSAQPLTAAERRFIKQWVWSPPRCPMGD